MRSHIRMVKGTGRGDGDYAISLSILDETQWSPTVSCDENDFVCPVPTSDSDIEDKIARDCRHGDFCTLQAPLSDFSNQDLNNARFSGSELSCTSFKRAKLHSADFSNSDLCQSDLTYTDLRDANFDGADLSFADLQYADLRGANLENVRFVDVELKGARFDNKTKLPISRDQAETMGMLYCF